MRSPVLCLVTILLASSAVAAHAAGSSRTLAVNAGLAVPAGDLSNEVGSGYLLGATYCYQFNDQFGLGIDGNYLALGEKDISSVAKERLTGGQGSLFGRYFLPVKDFPVAPYLKLGLYNYRLGFKTKTTTAGRSQESTSKQSKNGFGFGAGGIRKLNDRSSVGLELIYSTFDTNQGSAGLFSIALSYRYRVGK